MELAMNPKNINSIFGKGFYSNKLFSWMSKNA